MIQDTQTSADEVRSHDWLVSAATAARAGDAVCGMACGCPEKAPQKKIQKIAFNVLTLNRVSRSLSHVAKSYDRPGGTWNLKEEKQNERLQTRPQSSRSKLGSKLQWPRLLHAGDSGRGNLDALESSQGINEGVWFLDPQVAQWPMGDPVERCTRLRLHGRRALWTVRGHRKQRGRKLQPSSRWIQQKLNTTLNGDARRCQPASGRTPKSNCASRAKGRPLMSARPKALRWQRGCSKFVTAPAVTPNNRPSYQTVADAARRVCAGRHERWIQSLSSAQETNENELSDLRESPKEHL